MYLLFRDTKTMTVVTVSLKDGKNIQVSHNRRHDASDMATQGAGVCAATILAQSLWIIPASAHDGLIDVLPDLGLQPLQAIWIKIYFIGHINMWSSVILDEHFYQCVTQ